MQYKASTKKPTTFSEEGDIIQLINKDGLQLDRPTREIIYLKCSLRVGGYKEDTERNEFYY